MILLVGVVLGLIAGLISAWVTKRTYTLPVIRHIEIAFVAFLPQALAFFLPQSGQLVSQQWAAWILPISLGLLVIFAWFNRHVQGFGLLGLGLLLNLAVIVANGGLMPVSPETLAIVHGSLPQEAIDVRVSGTKSIVLSPEETRLEWLADRFTVPDQLPIQFAYSLGDVFLAIGAFWALWAGGMVKRPEASTNLKTHSYSS